MGCGNRNGAYELHRFSLGRGLCFRQSDGIGCITALSAFASTIRPDLASPWTLTRSPSRSNSIQHTVLSSVPRCGSPLSNLIVRLDVSCYRFGSIASPSRPSSNEHAACAYRDDGQTGHEGLHEQKPGPQLDNHDVFPLVFKKRSTSPRTIDTPISCTGSTNSYSRILTSMILRLHITMWSLSQHLGSSSSTEHRD
jgi:hypothetical protein